MLPLLRASRVSSPVPDVSPPAARLRTAAAAPAQARRRGAPGLPLLLAHAAGAQRRVRRRGTTARAALSEADGFALLPGPSDAAGAAEPRAESMGVKRRSAFRRLLAASAQATADVEAYETWVGRAAMTLFIVELCFEELSGGLSLFTRLDAASARAVLSAALGACAAGAAAAHLLLPVATRNLASATRGALSRALTSSILLVQEDGAKLRSVADDLYARALDASLDDVLGALDASLLASSAAGPNAAEGGLLAAPVLVTSSNSSGGATQPPVASAALLRAVLLESDETV